MLLFLCWDLLAFFVFNNRRDFKILAVQCCSAATCQNPGCTCASLALCVNSFECVTTGSPGCYGSGGGCQYGLTCNTSCVKINNCGANSQQGHCGWGVGGIEKVWCKRCTCNPAPSCSTTAPSNVSVTPVTLTSSRINWTPGSGGTSQRIYVGTAKAAVETNCPSGTGGGTGCTLAVTGLPISQTSYTTANVLATGTVYYYRVVNYIDGTCASNSATAKGLSSCALSPSAVSIQEGDSQAVNASVNSSTEVSQVTFSSSPTYVAVNPAADASYTYNTTVTGVLFTSPASVNLTANVYFTGVVAPACTATAAITVFPAGPWWQVKDSDIASNGDVNSKVPGAELFDLIGDGGYPGVPAYGGGTNLTSSNVSATAWLANSTSTNQKIYDYDYFANRVPEDVVSTITAVPSSVDGTFFESGGTLSGGYYWYKYDGSANGINLTLNSAMNLGNRKVILLVNSADFYINDSINLTKGQGFFLAVVGKGAGGTKGNIYVDPTLGGGSPDLEGIYIADGHFDTGDTDIALSVRGSVVAYNGVVMKRDLDTGIGNGSPAEFFEYAPDQILLFPSKLGVRKINWKEVAP